MAIFTNEELDFHKKSDEDLRTEAMEIMQYILDNDHTDRENKVKEGWKSESIIVIQTGKRTSLVEKYYELKREKWKIENSDRK